VRCGHKLDDETEKVCGEALYITKEISKGRGLALSFKLRCKRSNLHITGISIKIKYHF
jgi:hypothetical protein